MSKLDLITLDGLRVDGRRAKEVREIRCKIGALSGLADGSVYYEQGNTKCLVAIYGPHEPQSQTYSDNEKLCLTTRFKIATFAHGERRKRPDRDKQLVEMASTLQQTLESVIVLSSFPRSQVDIYVQVLQADGGVLAASINATNLALMDAGIPMKDYLVACTAGMYDDQPMCDLQALEEMRNIPYLVCGLLPKSGTLSLVGFEQSRLQLDKFEVIMNMAMDGCRTIKQVLEENVKQVTTERAMASLIK